MPDFHSKSKQFISFFFFFFLNIYSSERFKMKFFLIQESWYRIKKKMHIQQKKNDDLFIHNTHKMKEVEFDSVEEDLLFVICI